MRRSALAALALGLAVTVLSPLAPASVAAPASSAGDDRRGPTYGETTLQRVESLLAGPGELSGRSIARSHARAQTSDNARPATDPAELTLALRDLFVARESLDGDDRRRADGVLARPTNGDDDAYGDGYPAGAKVFRQCESNFCLHWVEKGKDAPPGAGWRKKTLQTMNQVWRREVDELGYRPPLPDGKRGGNATFDVYLKDLGSRGFYGYCAPERRKRGSQWQASGYCVLDNDFSRKQYSARPIESLRVTAAHEFFHSIQFGYDYGEDPWFMESTATWMEERFADGVNDNRQYLPFGQLAHPWVPLDTHQPLGFTQYGNWPFFEFLSSHFGPKIVRTIWRKAATFEGAPDLYSTEAVASALTRYGGFPAVFAAYAGANTDPASSYAEGRHWPSASPSRSWKLGAAERNRTRSDTLTINHLSARTATIRPGSSLGGRRWRLKISIDGPGQRTNPTAYLIVQRKQARALRRVITLDKAGRATVAIGFSKQRVRRASVTLANASTRFRCWRKARFSCQGTPRDNGQQFQLSVRAFKR